MTDRVTRAILAVLAVPNVIAGLWAVIDPAGWFESFPGWAPQLVAAYPPYNEHLAVDAGAGLLATGVLAAVAAVKLDRPVVFIAMLGFLAFALPHALFHLFDKGELDGSEAAVNAASLIIAAILAITVLMTRGMKRPEPAT